MTIQGTAATEEEEFFETYGLSVVQVPPHRPSRRRDHPARVYYSREEKYQHLFLTVSCMWLEALMWNVAYFA